MSVLKKDGGFTVIEIIVSMILIPLIWLAISTALSVNTMLISEYKHRAQAVFVAQGILDTLRAGNYVDIVPVINQPITIDTRGTVVTTDDLLGNINVLLVTSAAYYSHYKKVTVSVNWDENTVGAGVKNITETLATYISDDPAG